ncbi:MAG: hypothetical protein HY900_06295, partial [Deltaproteobacteria bacterium]|nr:hypothetical protein [Deltaproteobacteria bacterium]
MATCQSVVCEHRFRCAEGRCVAYPCDGVTCGPGLVCAPTGGSGTNCVPALCDHVTCNSGEICQIGTGMCVRDVCLGVNCRDPELHCEIRENRAQCVPNVPIVIVPRDRGVGTGGGGMFCSTSTPGSSGALPVGFGLLVALAFVRRRLRRLARALLPLAGLVVAFSQLGCET